MNHNERSALILSRARRLYQIDHPSVGWPLPSDVSHDRKLAKLQAQYMLLAESQLLREGVISDSEWS